MADWETENHLQARQAQDADMTVPATDGLAGYPALPTLNDVGEQPDAWSDQPTQPQRRIQAQRDWPAQSSDSRPEWPVGTASKGAAVSPLHRLLDAAHERQFSLGCGTLAALVLIVAALLAAFSNGWLPSNAGPHQSQPSIRANPAESTAPMPTVTPRPSPTATPVPTDTPVPTETPIPTDTPVPTESPVPTQTPIPAPTATPLPTQGPVATPTPSQSNGVPTPPAQP